VRQDGAWQPGREEPLGSGDNQRTVRGREEAGEGGGPGRGDSQRTVRAVGGNQRAGEVSNGASPPRPPRLLAQLGLEIAAEIEAEIGEIGLPPGGIETPSQEGDSEEAGGARSRSLTPQGESAGWRAPEAGASPVRGVSPPRRHSPASSVPSWLGEASAEEAGERRRGLLRRGLRGWVAAWTSMIGSTHQAWRAAQVWCRARLAAGLHQWVTAHRRRAGQLVTTHRRLRNARLGRALDSWRAAAVFVHHCRAVGSAAARHWIASGHGVCLARWRAP
jgi:hypothetical protein